MGQYTTRDWLEYAGILVMLAVIGGVIGYAGVRLIEVMRG